MSRLFLPNYDDLATFGRDRGSGTVLPTTDPRRGDVYEHTALGLHVYTGTLWAPIGPLPFCQVRQTTVQSIASSAWVPLTFQVADEDADGLFAAGAPDRVTIKKAGIYRLSGVVTPNTTTRIGAQLQKNGAALPNGTTNVNGSAPASSLTSPTILARFAATDYVRLACVQATGAAVNTIVSADTSASLLVECVRLL